MDKALLYLRSKELEIYKKFEYREPILDLGSGDGSFVRKFIPDKYIFMVDKNNKCEEPLFYPCDMSELPFETNTFNTIICNSVLEHIQGLTKPLMEAYRVLQKGGRMYLTVLTDQFAKNLLFKNKWYGERRNRGLDHYSCLTLEDWKRTFEYWDFKIIHYEGVLSSEQTQYWDKLGWLKFLHLDWVNIKEPTGFNSGTKDIIKKHFGINLNNYSVVFFVLEK